MTQRLRLNRTPLLVCLVSFAGLLNLCATPQLMAQKGGNSAKKTGTPGGHKSPAPKTDTPPPDDPNAPPPTEPPPWNSWEHLHSFTGLPMTQDGWTDLQTLVTHPGYATARIIYVSSSTGVNSSLEHYYHIGDPAVGPDPFNPVGDVIAYSTIAAGYALLRNGYPDMLLLKRGDVWDETLGHWRKSGKSAMERMIIGTYGAASAQPLLRTGTAEAFRRSGGGGSPARIDFIFLTGIDCHAHTRTSTSGGTGFVWLGLGNNVLVEDCKFRGYRNNLTIQQDGSNRPSEVALRRTVIVDSFSSSSHSQGLYADGIDGLLIEECVFDHNGWNIPEGAPPTIYNHNMYVQTNCADLQVIGNISARASSHGIQLRPGGLLKNNLFIQNSISGFVSSEVGLPSTVVDNVVLHGKDISESLPRGSGLEVLVGAGRGTILRHNIVAHRQATGVNGIAILVANDGTVLDGNVVFNWSSSSDAGVVFSHATPSTWEGMSMSNNTIVLESPGGQPMRIGSSSWQNGFASFSGNRYGSSMSNSQWFRIGSSTLSLAPWIDATSDAATATTSTCWSDPSRSIPTYQQHLGGTATIEAFLENARSQHRSSWDANYSAATVNDWIRAGFGQ